MTHSLARLRQLAGITESNQGNKFGDTWDALPRPIQALVAVIDPELVPQIGLTAMQINNLKLSTDKAVNSRDLAIMRNDNLDGIPDHRGYGKVTLSHGSNTVEVGVYNAFGKMATRRGDDRSSVRLSQGAARQLGVKVGDVIVIT